MKSLLSNGGSNSVEDVAKNLKNMLGNGRMQAYVFQPQADGMLERWNRTLLRGLACFVASGDSD